MSVAGTKAPVKFKTRRVRDSQGRIIQVRQFDPKAKVNDTCFIINIKRDPSTQYIIGSWSTFDKVVQEDLDWTN